MYERLLIYYFYLDFAFFSCCVSTLNFLLNLSLLLYTYHEHLMRQYFNLNFIIKLTLVLHASFKALKQTNTSWNKKKNNTK